MYMGLVVLFLVAAVIGVVVDTLLLLGFGRLFGFTELTRMRALKAAFFSMLVSSLVFLLLVFVEYIVLLIVPGATVSSLTERMEMGLGLLVSIVVLAYFVRRYTGSIVPKAFMIATLVVALSSAITYVAAAGIRTFVAAPFVVSGTGMEPTYTEGRYLILQKFDRTYDRNDVIVFEDETGAYRIERIVGLPGEDIRIEGAQIFIDDTPLATMHGTASTTLVASFTPQEGEYVVVGDNEFAHPAVVPAASIQGTVFFAI